MNVLAGQVSLTHIIFWTPGAIMLWRDRKNFRWPTAYSVWMGFVAVFYTVSMVFDVRDASIYLVHLVS